MDTLKGMKSQSYHSIPLGFSKLLNLGGREAKSKQSLSSYHKLFKNVINIIFYSVGQAISSV